MVSYEPINCTSDKTFRTNILQFIYLIKITNVHFNFAYPMIKIRNKNYVKIIQNFDNENNVQCN